MRKPVNDKIRRRAYLGVIFKCCRIYSRIYLNKKGDAYVGWCPRCGARMEIKISPVGTDSRFFFAE